MLSTANVRLLAIVSRAITSVVPSMLIATILLTQLARAHQEDRLEEKIICYSKPKLLIIDELGYLPFEPKQPICFFS